MKNSIIYEDITTSSNSIKKIESLESIIFLNNLFLDDINRNLTFENCIFNGKIFNSLSVIEKTLTFKNCIFKQEFVAEIIAFDNIYFLNNIFVKDCFLMDSEIKKNIQIEKNIFHGYTDILLFGNGKPGSGTITGTKFINDNIITKKERGSVTFSQFLNN